MDDSAREAAPSGTEEPDAEDNEDRDELMLRRMGGQVRPQSFLNNSAREVRRSAKVARIDGLVASAQQIVVHPFYLGVPPRF